ncbi:MAG: DUF86 domain-containing protein [Planctomycetota bacterium]
MTDTELLFKKLALIDTCVQEILTLGQLERIDADVREQRFLEHTLQIAIQAALDVASHVISDLRLGEPRNNRDLFEILARCGWIPPSLIGPLRRMVGFRNVLVHGYDVVDLDVVKDIVRNHLGDLTDFVRAVRDRLRQ